MGHLLKATEVAARLGVSKTWVYEAAADGRLPHLRLPGEKGQPGPVRFDADAVDAWLENQRRNWRPGRGVAA